MIVVETPPKQQRQSKGIQIYQHDGLREQHWHDLPWQHGWQVGLQIQQLQWPIMSSTQSDVSSINGGRSISSSIIASVCVNLNANQVVHSCSMQRRKRTKHIIYKSLYKRKISLMFGLCGEVFNYFEIQQRIKISGTLVCILYKTR